MKKFLKILIGGTLGLGALYVVGKVCYEAGKEVAEVERQLAENDPVNGDPEMGEHIKQFKEDLDKDLGPIDKTLEEAKKSIGEAIDDAWKKHTKPTAFGRLVNKVKNAKMFLAVKKAFDKGEREPGILGSLLTNPDGARIEAFVKDGGVQINVKPRAA